jgi:SAM-dependent methyltransferase
MNCRHCQTSLKHVFLDLGFAPPSNAYLRPENLQQPELNFPLKLYVCENCWLVQTQDFACAEELFTEDYAYFSSVSQSWLEHAAHYCKMIQKRLGLSPTSFVIEIGSNDGYLLKNFVSMGIPCLGVEPTESTADVAEQRGIPLLRRFFNTELAGELATEGKRADLIIGNNVYAHVPDVNDFTAGLKTALKPSGTITLEFPHLLKLIEENQFDTVYHEHFSYFSLYTIMRIFQKVGLRVYDLEKLSTHGGSLRVYGCHTDDPRPETSMVEEVLKEEDKKDLRRIYTYLEFQAQANRVKNDLLMFLIEQKRLGKTVAAYGAAAKGNTLLNYAGVKPDLISFVCDAAPSKQGKFLPGSHIPIRPPSALTECRPDWVVILPWNIAGEVISQQAGIRSWGAKFVVAVPELKFI